jgi:hypothetical protein
MRSPMIVWRRMNSHSSSRAPGLSRIASGCHLAHRAGRRVTRTVDLLGVGSRRRATASASLATPLMCSPSSGLRSASAQRHVATLVARRAARCLVGVHALVGDAQRLAGVVRLAGHRDHAEGRVMTEAVAVLGERGGAGSALRDGSSPTRS